LSLIVEIALGVFLGIWLVGLVFWEIPRGIYNWRFNRDWDRAQQREFDLRYKRARDQGCPKYLCGGSYDLGLWESAWRDAAGDSEKQQAVRKRAVVQACEGLENLRDGGRRFGDWKTVKDAERQLAELRAQNGALACDHMTKLTEAEAKRFQRWSVFQRAKNRPEAEITPANWAREIDLDKRTRCRDCGTTNGTGYAVYDNVWTATGLAPNGGLLCLADLALRLGRPLRLDDFPMERPINRENRGAILRAMNIKP
jgi:hypothetical protein